MSGKVREIPLVYVIILNWNGLQMTKACLKDLKKQSFTNYKTVVIDNGSSDGSVEWLKSQSINLVQNSNNLGFARAINQGFSLGISEGADYVVSLNNDVLIDKNWLQVLVDGMENDSSLGFAQGATMMQDDKTKFDSTGIYLEKGFIPNQRAINSEIPHLEVPAIGPNAAGAIYRSSMLTDVSISATEFFDNRFFAYVEDVDFNLRCCLRGYKFGFFDKALLYHKGSATGSRIAKRKMFWGSRNMVWLVFKNAPLAILGKNYKIIIKSHLANLQFLYRNQKKNFLPYVSGLFIGIIALPLFINKRSKNLKKIVLSNDEFNELLVASSPPLENPLRKLAKLLKYK